MTAFLRRAAIYAVGLSVVFGITYGLAHIGEPQSYWLFHDILGWIE